jgi:hypothetical protein
MDIHMLYHAVAMKNREIQQLTLDAEKTTSPELKQAYEVIKSNHVSTLTVLHGDLVRKLSTMVAELPEPPK